TNVVVGEAAKQSAFIDADSVVSLIKRQMGEDREYEFHGVVHTPESISALILRRLATDATNYTSGPVEQVVISVPAYFGARQKEATYQAGLIAGLDVVASWPSRWPPPCITTSPRVGPTKRCSSTTSAAGHSIPP